MKRWLYLFLIVVVLLFGSGMAAAQTLTYQQTFPGTACNQNWATDMYVMIDQSAQGANPRWTMEAEYIPSRDNDTRYITQFDLADYGNMIVYTMRDFVCETFPSARGNGTIILRSETPFYAWHKSEQRWMRYGAAVPPSFTLSQEFLYVWFGDTVPDDKYRFNVFLFNASEYDYGLLWINNDLYALEPKESVTVLAVPSTGLIDIVEGYYLHVVVTMVDNVSNDGVICPLIIRDLF